MRRPPARAPHLLRRALLVAAIALLPRHASGEPPSLSTRVDAAIERGVAWLVGEQDGGGSWDRGPDALGPTALVAYALLHAGVVEEGSDRASRALARAFAWLTREEPRDAPAARATGTYARAFLRLALDLRGRNEDRAWGRRLARALVSAQSANGQWAYETPTTSPPAAGDNSNAQIAALALGVAAAVGDPVPAITLERAARWWREHAQADGGFGYASGGGHPSASTGSMTAAGIASLAQLALATGRVDGASDDLAGVLIATEPVLGRAEAHLKDVFRVDRNDGPPAQRLEARRAAGRGWLHYYLWSVERALVLLGRERLGEIDWYRAGAEHLLVTQSKDGSWRGERALYATSFALLFLTRAADPPRAFTPRAREPRGPVTPREGGPAIAPDAARTLDVPRAVRDATSLADLLDAVRAGGAASLIDVAPLLDDRDPAIRRRAHEVLVASLPIERTANADRHPLARRRLRLWLRRFAPLLVWRDGAFRL